MTETATPTEHPAPASVRPDVTAAQLADSLDALGHRHQVLSGTIRPVATGLRAAGVARTLRFVPTEVDSADPYRDFIDFMDTVEAGEVVVIATGGCDRSAYWGELFSAAALGRGAAGAVLDGPARDTAAIAALGFPVFAAGARPIDYRGRMRVDAAQVSVECGGVTIAPGDLVVADGDGVVAAPGAVAHQAAAAADSRAAGESTVLAELRAGARLGEVWERYGLL
ncbi:RraA family protein [Streptomyces sp. NPDC002795]|uniref:RraA family protein n=1 Tax=Streptomyces sp. NPDC002795 TaxID=3364665 RepID=UPI0036903ECF